MIDIHSRLLPNLDDGSRSSQQSAEVLKRFAGAGLSAVILTPHVSASELTVDPRPVGAQGGSPRTPLWRGAANARLRTSGVFSG